MVVGCIIENDESVSSLQIPAEYDTEGMYISRFYYMTRGSEAVESRR